MSIEAKIKPLIILLHTRGIGRAKGWKLIQEFGSAQKVIEAGFDSKKRLLFGQFEVLEWEKDLELAEKHNIQLIAYDDALYPKAFKDLSDFPLLLYVKGDFNLNYPSIAVIGTRNATLYGKQMAEKISFELASAGVCVVSGLARGIDTAAHIGALKAQGKTLAILGSGLGQVYPKENGSLAKEIAGSGAVISEFPLQTPPSKELFPRRNRLVSGLSLGVCLIESPLEGGGMLTMNLAEKQNKALFALPGRVDWPTFEGNHLLIKEKKAQLIEKGSDLLRNLNISHHPEVKALKPSSLTAEEEAFLKKIPCEEKTIEELVLLTQLPIMQLNVFLTKLILKKVVKEFPGKIYKKN